MPKVKGPLFSIEAFGTLAGAITYKKGKEGNRVEKVPKPHDRRSAAQATERNLFKSGASVWKTFSENTKRYYENLASGRHMTGYNYFMMIYILGKYVPGHEGIEAGYGYGIYGESSYGM